MWKLVISDHIRKRMRLRRISEAEDRRMLGNARRYRRSATSGTFLVTGKVRGDIWDIAVAPEHQRRRLVVVTAFVRTSAR